MAFNGNETFYIHRPCRTSLLLTKDNGNRILWHYWKELEKKLELCWPVVSRDLITFREGKKGFSWIFTFCVCFLHTSHKWRKGIFSCTVYYFWVQNMHAAILTNQTDFQPHVFLKTPQRYRTSTPMFIVTCTYNKSGQLLLHVYFWTRQYGNASERPFVDMLKELSVMLWCPCTECELSMDLNSSLPFVQTSWTG